MDSFREYRKWTERKYFDDRTREELKSIKDDKKEIASRFAKELEFGTAGLRGVLGAGTYRMNIYTVRRISYAIAKHVISLGEEAVKAGIVIGHDTRNCSDEFAKEAASVYAGMGIRTYLYNMLCPVPVLSFSVRELCCSMGVMITASHNPKEYNGYKVYGPDGAQLSPDDSDKISKIASETKDYTKIPRFDYDILRKEGKIEDQPSYLREKYFEAIEKLCVHGDDMEEEKKNFKVVYTPLHGTGAFWVPDILKRIGMENVYPVKEQMIPDGNFSTVPVPNPENVSVYDLAVKLAEEKNANLILATDPDADRTGVFAKGRDGFVMLSGNQIGILLLNYLISDKQKKNAMPKDPFVVSTVVSTRLTKKICEAKGVEYRDVLTGFKFIGEQIAISEETGKGNFIFGFEESYGYLAGSYARDKDAVASCMLLSEAAATYASQGKTLLDVLNDIYREFGYSCEKQVSLMLSNPAEGASAFMTRLRRAPISLDCSKVTGIKDYLKEETGLPKSDVLYYTLEDGWFCVRPSGTEPKVKLYFGASGKCPKCAETICDRIKDEASAKIKELF